MQTRFSTAEFIARVRYIVNEVAPRVVAWLNSFAASTKDAAASIQAQDASNTIVTLLDEVEHLKEYTDDIRESRDYYKRTSDEVARNAREVQAKLRETKDELKVAQSAIEALSSGVKNRASDREMELRRKLEALNGRYEAEIRAHDITNNELALSKAMVEKLGNYRSSNDSQEAIDKLNAQLREKDATIEKLRLIQDDLRKFVEGKLASLRAANLRVEKSERDAAELRSEFAASEKRSDEAIDALIERVGALNDRLKAATQMANKYGDELEVTDKLVAKLEDEKEDYRRKYEGVKAAMERINAEFTEIEESNSRRGAFPLIDAAYRDGKRFAYGRFVEEIAKLDDSSNNPEPKRKPYATVITEPEQESTPSHAEHIAFLRSGVRG